MAEVEKLCDRVIVINNGTIVANDTPGELSKLIKNSRIELLVEKNSEKLTTYLEKNKIKYKKIKKLFAIDVTTAHIAATLQDLTKQGVVYDELSIEKPSLEDYFLETIKDAGKEQHEVS